MTEHQSRGEYRFLHRDGTYHWLHDEFNLVRDKQGGPLEYVGSLIDVTAAREAQEKLALSERRYRAIVECQRDLIDRFLPDGTPIYVNDAVCRLLGKSREELIGQSFLPFLTTEARELVQAQLKSLTPELPEAESEQEVIMPDGSSRWLAWINYAFFDDQGRVRELQGVGRDITRRKEVEEACAKASCGSACIPKDRWWECRLLRMTSWFMLILFLRKYLVIPPRRHDRKGRLDLVHPDDRDFIGQK